MHLLTDHFTRFAWIVSSKTQMAKDFVNLVNGTKNVEMIKTLLSDQYPGINSSEFKRHLKRNGIELIFTAADCAFSNGLNERANQTLVNRIRCKIYENGDKSWPAVASECVKEYNNTVHSSTGFTPSDLFSGTDKSIMPPGLNENKLSNLEENRKIALETSSRNHLENKSRYDKNVVDINYQPGDLVYIQNGNKLNRNKLEAIRSGP